ncbi:MAG: DUF167 domain-containing protein [Candidatus Pacebacteria bacterium]|nr:DUF167 domain-containing protein [Candidatus Paceibacterota bacterium]
MQVSVRVTAGASKEKVEALSDTRLKIAVKQKAEAGLANARVVELVAKHFGVPVKTVRIVKGHKAPSKIFKIG